MMEIDRAEGSDRAVFQGQCKGQLKVARDRRVGARDSRAEGLHRRHIAQQHSEKVDHMAAIVGETLAVEAKYRLWCADPRLQAAGREVTEVSICPPPIVDQNRNAAFGADRGEGFPVIVVGAAQRFFHEHGLQVRHRGDSLCPLSGRCRQDGDLGPDFFDGGREVRFDDRNPPFVAGIDKGGLTQIDRA